MKRSMRRLTVITIFALFSTGFLPTRSFAQDGAAANRKLVNRVMPEYPKVARLLHLGGNVKLEVAVGPNGLVKSMEVKGGHPVLVQAAEDAVRKWKWAPTPHETTEPVTVKFDPND
jgi:TonB family protein